MKGWTEEEIQNKSLRAPCGIFCGACKQKCEFMNVTCYQPDCGFTGMDNRLKPTK